MFPSAVRSLCARWSAVAWVSMAPIAADATYSICATDSAARQVGGVGTSCVAPSSVHVIYGSSPGHGVVHAQAFVNSAGRNEAVFRLDSDEAPADIIDAMTDPLFDGAADLRQYGIVDLQGRSAGFTGAQTTSYAEDRQGTSGAFADSVQGNILTSVAVIDQTEDGFVHGGGCDLADRLMLALEAGAEGGEGDSRCTPTGIPSDAAFIQVDREDEPAGEWLFLEVRNVMAPDNPITLLRQQYDAWRLAHPCPLPPDGGLSLDGAPSDGVTDADNSAEGADSSGCACGVWAVSGPVPHLLLLIAAILAVRRKTVAAPTTGTAPPSGGNPTNEAQAGPRSVH